MDVPTGVPMDIPIDAPLDVPMDVPVGAPMDVPIGVPVGPRPSGHRPPAGARPFCSTRAGPCTNARCLPRAGKSMVSEQKDKVQAAKVGRGRFGLTTEEKRDSSH